MFEADRVLIRLSQEVLVVVDHHEGILGLKPPLDQTFVLLEVVQHVLLFLLGRGRKPNLVLTVLPQDGAHGSV